MAVKVILEGKLDETVRNGEVLAATLDEGATVGAGMHVRITSVDKHKEHRALGLLAGQRVRVTVEVIADAEVGAPELPEPEMASPAPLRREVVTSADRWSDLVDKVDRRRQLQTTTA